MQHSFWFMIATTPWWVYLLLFCAARVSLLITQPRLISIKPLYFASLPLIVFALVASYVVPPSKEALLFAIPLLAIGGLLGILRPKWQGVRARLHTQQLLLPGSWVMFIGILLLFVARQYAVYHAGIDMLDWAKTHGQHFLLPAYMFAIGITGSQLWYFRHLLKNGPYVTHEELKGIV